MAGKFLVDVVATPRLDLCSAAAKDLMYRDANGKYPMNSRSQMAKEQEKLNKFLRYVNESFIIKGFSKNSAAQQSAVQGYTARNTAEELWMEGEEIVLCDFQISHGEGAQILVMFTLTGDGMSASSVPALVTVSVTENNSQVAQFRQYADGYFTMSAPFLLANREAGVTQVKLTAAVSGGEVYVDKEGYFGQAIRME